MKNKSNQGFTLIELVLVVAILAMIATVAVGKFSDMQKKAARKASLANCANIARVINTEIAQSDNVLNMFDYVESLLDVSPSGSWKGSEGSYDWTLNSGYTIPGIYRGIKTTGVVANANGVTTGAIMELEEARKNNTGINSDLLKYLGVYYLKTEEVKALNEVGISRVLFHNPSNQQSSTYAASALSSGFSTENNLATRNGGPGQRPDMSAFYPVILTNGSPVVVLNPRVMSRGSNQSIDIYRALGVEVNYTKTLADAASNEESYFTSGICPRLVLFGLGRSSDITSRLFEAPPRSEELGKTEYRNYILVFSMLNGSGNTGYKAKFVGVLTPTGKTIKAAEYSVDWE